jgi:hypothetical protein
MVAGNVNKTPKVPPARRTPAGNPDNPPNRTENSNEAWPFDVRVLATHPNAETARDQVMVQQHVLPAERTVRNWLQRSRELGHIIQFRRSGGQRTSALVGTPVILIALYRAVYPQATAAEINTFLFNSHGRHLEVPRFYAPSQIHGRNRTLGYHGNGQQLLQSLE